MAATAPARDACERWFRQYARSFQDGNAEDRRNILLKEEHTWRVQSDAIAVAEALGLDAHEIGLAALVGLFHDVGRFPQYRQYRTFRDSDSVNHAALGARVLIEEGVVQDLAREERNLVVRAVVLHNVFLLPPGLDLRLDLHARIVRDADKLDIWKIFAELFGRPENERPTAAGLGLPDTPGFTRFVLDRLPRREMVQLSELRCLNDFKLLQLSWLFDLNFPPSFHRVLERDLIGRIAATLPDDASIRTALDGLVVYAQERSGRC